MSNPTQRVEASGRAWPRLSPRACVLLVYVLLARFARLPPLVRYGILEMAYRSSAHAIALFCILRVGQFANAKSVTSPWRGFIREAENDMTRNCPAWRFLSSVGNHPSRHSSQRIWCMMNAPDANPTA